MKLPKNAAMNATAEFGLVLRAGLFRRVAVVVNGFSSQRSGVYEFCKRNVSIRYATPTSQAILSTETDIRKYQSRCDQRICNQLYRPSHGNVVIGRSRIN